MIGCPDGALKTNHGPLNKIARARFRLQITKKRNNPTLQFDRSTASRTFRLTEAPSPIQSPNAPDYAGSFPCPVYVLPFQSQILTRSHPSGERYRKHWAVRSRQSSLKECLRLLHRQRTHFALGLLRDFDAIGRILKQLSSLDSLPHGRLLVRRVCV